VTEATRLRSSSHFPEDIPLSKEVQRIYLGRDANFATDNDIHAIAQVTFLEKLSHPDCILLLQNHGYVSQDFVQRFCKNAHTFENNDFSIVESMGFPPAEPPARTARPTLYDDQIVFFRVSTSGEAEPPKRANAQAAVSNQGIGRCQAPVTCGISGSKTLPRQRTHSAH
jgi:hypothetical protein